MSGRAVFTNARLVLADRTIKGTLVVADGVIEAVDSAPSSVPGAIDCAQDLLLPGLVELHTDNLEKHIAPRPGVEWPAVPAVMAHDAQVAAAGITTVLDAITVGATREEGVRQRLLDTMVGALREARAAGMLRADHRLHLRCEVSAPNVVEMVQPLRDDPLVQLASLMDHTPGQRQFVDPVTYKRFYQNKLRLDDAGMEAWMEERRRQSAEFADDNRQALVALCRESGIVTASHDDQSLDHVAEAREMGVAISEFPTTLEAARAAREAGLKILMGAPNLIRGGSHSGNVSAGVLADEDLLDILSSDYVPSALLLAAFHLAGELHGIPLAQTIATVTKTPAEAVGLDDRGELAPGKRADLIRIRQINDLPVVRGVWREGNRVA